MGVFQNNLLAGAAAAASAGGGAFYSYQIEQSSYFDGTSSKLTKTFSSAATNNDKGGISVWIKRNSFAKATDTIGIISSPLRDLVSIWSIFKIID